MYHAQHKLSTEPRADLVQEASRRPFLKWAGGKRWLARGVAALLRHGSGGYVEPFVGSGAVFFALRPSSAVLADSNAELIAAYIAVRDAPDAVISALSDLQVTRDVYEQMRASTPQDSTARAVRLIYLNRTSFNGIYRVNRDGRFNVPYGARAGTVPCDPARIRDCSRALQRVELRHVHADALLASQHGENRFYFDPPYTVRHNQNAFRRYNEALFSWADQVRLADHAARLAAAGADVVVSNAAHGDVMGLYDRDLFHHLLVTRSSRMAAASDARGPEDELLAVSKTVRADAHGLVRLIQASLGRGASARVSDDGSIATR